MIRKHKSIWVLVNCNTKEEAMNIGNNALKKRLISCFDVFSREVSRYFWPPKENKIEETKGCLLILKTLKEKYEKLTEFIEKLHSDKEPFIGFIPIYGLKKSYFDWMKGELKTKRRK